MSDFFKNFIMCQAPVAFLVIVWVILNIFPDLTDLIMEKLISYSLDLTAALIALLVFKITNLHRNIVGRLITAKK